MLIYCLYGNVGKTIGGQNNENDKKAWKIRADIYTVRKSGNFLKMLSGNDAEKKAGQRSESMHGN